MVTLHQKTVETHDLWSDFTAGVKQLQHNSETHSLSEGCVGAFGPRATVVGVN